MLKEKLKNLFIPSQENGYKPNFLERFSMGAMLVLVLLSFAIANLQALLWISSDWMVSTILPAVIVDLTNEERETSSLVTLKRNDVLDRAAKLKAEDMAKYEYFAHYSPTGVSPWHWFDEVSYDFVNAGENLAVHFTDSGEVVHAWMNSPSHRANIMNGAYTEIGVGTAKGEYKGFPTIFVVQLFGTPAAQATEPEKTVAGAITEIEPEQNPDLTLETVVIPEETTPTSTEAVAPATLETIPEPVKTETPTSTPEAVVPTQLSEENPVAVPALEPAQPQETVVMYSDLATTSRPGVPAVTNPTSGNQSTGETNVLVRSVTQPGLWLQVIYGILAFIVTIALILSIVIEWRRQNPVQIAYATGLLAAMLILFHVHTVLTSGVTII